MTYDELDRSDEVRACHPLLAEVAGHIEDQQIRDRGTIGGNCCLSDPTNNLPPLLVALECHDGDRRSPRASARSRRRSSSTATSPPRSTRASC